MDKMKILLKIILIGVVFGVAILVYGIAVLSVIIAEFYLLGLLFPGINNSEILIELVMITLTFTTGGIAAVTTIYLFHKHMERKGLI